MIEVGSYKIRFGDLSFGPFVHPAKFFDLLIIATEELSYELGYTTEEIVAADGVPYAPVATWGELERYPEYGDTVRITVDPLEITDRSVRCEYRFARQRDGQLFGRAQIVHVTITAAGRGEQVPAASKERLNRIRGPDPSPSVPVEPRGVSVAEPPIDRTVVFRTPDIEAAGLGYFEDYVRQFTIALEEYLDRQGRSLRSWSDPEYPFFVTDWELAFDQSITFEDRIRIVGQFREVTPDAVRVSYAFEGADAGESRIAADVTYGSFTADGDRTQFPADLLATLE
jgi:acyl-CoA thioesterase FadM